MPWDLFCWCVVRHLWYLCFLNSLMYLQWAAWVSDEYVVPGAVLVAPFFVSAPHPLAPLDWVAALVRRILLGHHPGSRLIVYVYVNVSTSFPSQRAYLLLKFVSLLFGFSLLHSVL